VKIDPAGLLRNIVEKRCNYLYFIVSVTEQQIHSRLVNTGMVAGVREGRIYFIA
jgi:hypothetical protein